MAMENEKREVFVYSDWDGLAGSMLMGKLLVNRTRGKEIFAFEYDSEWMNSGFNMYLDPNLRLFKGQQYLPDDKPNFGMFLDSSPDRWGRLLMRRREAAMSRKEGRKEERS